MACMSNRERFHAVMQYRAVDRVPNYEVGIWPQTLARWEAEGCPVATHNWDWFTGDPAFEMDHREYIDVNYDMIPPFPYTVLERTEKYEVIQDEKGVVRRALREGTISGGRVSMDTYLHWPVQDLASFEALKTRFPTNLPERYPDDWENRLAPAWNSRDHVLVLGRNCSMLGFYWRAREWMGTEMLSYAWYEQPELIEAMMEFIADFTIAVSRPILEKVQPDYIFINEDMAMKTGPLLSPALYQKFIFPHMRRLVEFHKAMGVRYAIVDSDGNMGPLIPLLLDAGVDGIFPLERASEGNDPYATRKQYGKALTLWGVVDKRELAKDKAAIDQHLMSLAPLLEEGGFFPMVDHTVPPDVSYANFRHYMERKQQLLQGVYF